MSDCRRSRTGNCNPVVEEGNTSRRMEENGDAETEPRETNEALSVNKSTPPACEKVPAAKGGEIMNEILIENCGVEPVEGVEDLNVNEGTPPVCQHGHKIQENGGIPPVCGNVSMRIEEPNAPITEQVQGVKQGHVEVV